MLAMVAIIVIMATILEAFKTKNAIVMTVLILDLPLLGFIIVAVVSIIWHHIASPMVSTSPTKHTTSTTQSSTPEEGPTKTPEVTTKANPNAAPKTNSILKSKAASTSKTKSASTLKTKAVSTSKTKSVSTSKTKVVRIVTTKAKSFLDLPAEIRNEIYEMVLPTDQTLNIVMLYGQEKPVLKNTVNTLIYPAILKENRTVYHETMSMLYGANKFHFDSTVVLKAFVEKAWCSIKHIRHVTIDLKWPDIGARPDENYLLCLKHAQGLQGVVLRNKDGMVDINPIAKAFREAHDNERELRGPKMKVLRLMTLDGHNFRHTYTRV